MSQSGHAQKKINFEWKLVTGFSMAILLVAVVGVFAFYYNNKRFNISQLINHASQVSIEAEKTLSLTVDIESGARGFVITGDSNYLEHFRIAKDSIFDHITRLRALTINNIPHLAVFDSLKPVVEKRIRFSESTIQLRAEKGVEAATELIVTRHGKIYTDRIRNIISTIQRTENDLLIHRQKENDKSIASFNRAFFTFFIGVFILLIAILISIYKNIAARRKAENVLANLNNDLERKVMERSKALYQSERRFRALVEHAEDIITLNDRDGKVMYVSPAFERITGFSLSDAIGKASPAVKPPDKAGESERFLKEALERPGIPIRCVTRILNAQGQYILVEGTITNMLDDENVAAIVSNFKDVTARAEAEQKLSESEQRFRVLVENDYSITSLMNEKFETIYRSPSSERITGWTSEERESIGPNDLTHPDEKEYINQIMMDLLAHPGISMPMTIRTKHKNGHYVWLEGVAINRLSDPGVKGIITNLRDVTDRKKAEEGLRESEEKYRSVIENSLDAILITDADGTFLSVNKAACKMFGYTQEEMKAVGRKGIVDIHDPAVLAAIALRAKTDSFVGEFNCVRKNKEIFPTQTASHSFALSNGEVCVSTIIRDMTEQKKLELQRSLFESIVNSSEDAIISKKLDGTITSWNKGAERLFGFSAMEAIGKNVRMLVPPDRLNEEAEIMEEIRQGQYIDHYETERVRKNGSSVFISLTVSPIKDISGVIVGASKIARDISDRMEWDAGRKKAEEEVYNLNLELEKKVAKRTAELEGLNKELEGFTYSVSHDLRAPLRIVDGFCQILVEDNLSKLDDEGKRTLKIIEANVQRMGQLIDDLLDFSRLGKAEIHKSSVKMNEIVEEAIQELRVSGTSAPKRLHIGNLKPANADANLIKQVWINLIGNAIKYSGKKATPVIEIGMKAEEGRNIYFIKDNGTGFDMKYYHKLFGVFQRLHDQAEFTGTGVGLALVQRIVTRHGGKVWAEAKPDEGAVFYFSLSE